MTAADILHFEQLKNEVQAQYLLNHTPSFDEISKWKGIDIIYFQEDLRKKAKGNISEKSFYTYFKTAPVTKLPRIDMLNLLSVYAGYQSWYEFKKKHLFADEHLAPTEEQDNLETENPTISTLPEIETRVDEKKDISVGQKESISPILQNNSIENQEDKNIWIEKKPATKKPKSTFVKSVKNYLWLGISAILAVVVGLLGFGDQIFSKDYTFRFIDADRNTLVNDNLEIKIMKEDGESPILFKLKPYDEFTYNTKSKTLKMVVTSTFYKEATITRNLENSPSDENIELQPNDFAQMLFFYTKKMPDLKRKRNELNNLISNNATIYQVFDNDTYGVETMDKQRYITLVTLPTTSLENLEVIDTKTDTNGKISMIKFRIKNEDKNP